MRTLGGRRCRRSAQSRTPRCPRHDFSGTSPRSVHLPCCGRSMAASVSAEVLAMDQQELQAEILSLQRRVRFLLALLRLALRLPGAIEVGGDLGRELGEIVQPLVQKLV